MNDKYYNISLKLIVFLIIVLVGASFGASYADNNNKEAILKVVNSEIKPTYLSFSYDGEIRYFMIVEITRYNYQNYDNISLINETIKP